MRWWIQTELVFVIASAGAVLAGNAGAGEAARVIAVADPRLVLAPYAWQPIGRGSSSQIEATMPGAYLRAAFRGSSRVELIVDGTGNHGCPAVSMPVIEYSIDEGPFRVVPLTSDAHDYRLVLGQALKADTTHRLEIVFRASDLTRRRWESPETHLRLSGLVLDPSGEVVRSVARPKRAIGFGDSITEGVGVDGLFTSWQILGVNDARTTWFPMVCAGLDCEYGQLGSGGFGMTRKIHLPPLVDCWDQYQAGISRLVNGRLVPEPDYIFCSLGTNDYDKDIRADYTKWLRATRGACPDAEIFCVVPPLGVHREEIMAAARARLDDGDRRVAVIDTARLQGEFRAGQGPTRLAFDGVHPTVFGQAMLASLIAVEAERILAARR